MDKSDKVIVRLEDKVDVIQKDISKINVTLAAQHAVLKEHIKRTAALEKIVPTLKTQADMAVGMVKLIGFIAVLASIVGVAVMFVK